MQPSIAWSDLARPGLAAQRGAADGPDSSELQTTLVGFWHRHSALRAVVYGRPGSCRRAATRFEWSGGARLLLGPRRQREWSAVLALITLVFACARPSSQEAGSERAYVPGLGEIMSATQMRHAKLWYAGDAQNWPLASYEVDELEEGFADAVRFHPAHKHSPRPLTELVPEFTAGPLAALRAAIARRNQADFVAAHDALTQGCNACHVATGFSFNVVVRPTFNPYSNQDFETPR